MKEAAFKIGFYDTKPYDRLFFEPLSRGTGLSIRFFDVRLSPETAALATGCDAVCAFVNDSLDAAVIDILAGGGVRLAALRCAGYNQVDLKAAYGRLHVVRVPEYSPHAVAEHAVALLLALNRKTHKAYFRTRDANFAINGLMGFDLHGKTAGIVGTGKIGRVMVDILLGFGMNILAHDPFPHPSLEGRPGVRYAPLDDLYAQSDVISLHCPLTPANVHMINADSIARMKPGVVLINTGRGKLIHTRDLVKGLKSGRIGAAGLDVYEEETEYFFEDYSNEVLDDDVLARLLTFPNVLITSHQAFFTREALENIARTTLSNLDAFLRRGELPNEICYRCCENTCRRKTEGKCF